MDDRIVELLLSITLCAVSILLGFLFGELKEKAVKSGKESAATRGGIRCLLQGRILDICDKALEQGYLNVRTFEMLDDLEFHYKALGGNGAVKRLLSDVKKLEIKGVKTNG